MFWLLDGNHPLSLCLSKQDKKYVMCVQVLLLIRQMEATSAQAAASKVSLLMLGQQAIMDAHLCLLHLTTGQPPFNDTPFRSVYDFLRILNRCGHGVGQSHLMWTDMQSRTLPSISDILYAMPFGQ